MAEPDNTGGKQARGRFRPGQSGNPKGRPQGSRHRVSLLVESLIEARAEDIANVALRNAIEGGDPVLLRALLDRLAPPRKERPVTVDLPPLTNPTDGPKIAAALLERAASGELTPSEAQGLAALLEAFRKQTELANFEERLAALEASHAKR
jgi:hypothetical protein